MTHEKLTIIAPIKLTMTEEPRSHLNSVPEVEIEVSYGFLPCTRIIVKQEIGNSALKELEMIVEGKTSKCYAMKVEGKT